jgi:hypothetical protein
MFIRPLSNKQYSCCSCDMVLLEKRMDRFKKTVLFLVSAGIITGIINTPLVILNTTLFNLAPSDGPRAISQFLSGIISNPVIRDILSGGLIEIADKTHSLMLAAVVALLLHDILNKNHPDGRE